MHVLKRAFDRLPEGYRVALKSFVYAQRMKRGRFVSDEPEFRELNTIVGDGDWVIDVGANIGHYTLRLASLVGNAGRVFAIEPVPETFAVLAANVMHAGCRNVTLLNLGVSNRAGESAMVVPQRGKFGRNFYMAKLAEIGDLRVFCGRLDALEIEHRISLLKIDAEGHEIPILEGAEKVIARDRPFLIVEATSAGIRTFLERHGYRTEALPGSPNVIGRP